MNRVAASTAPQGLAIGCWLLAVILGLTLHATSVLEHDSLAGAFFGQSWRQSVIQGLGGEVHPLDGAVQVTVPLTGPFLVTVALIGASCGLTAMRLRRRHAIDWQGALLQASAGIVRWSLIGATWGYLWLIASLQGWQGTLQFLASIESLILALTVAGCAHAMWWIEPQSPTTHAISRVTPGFAIFGLMAVYILVFVAMNWGLWFNLRLPHGDSAMYEEHLWNLEHGKGFRSYLDQGLFLGEHIQFIHVALVPLHLLWPSHLLLELCESLALALAIVPIYRMTLRHTSCQLAGHLLAAAYLCWFGVHYVDIAIDLKTFRPIAFGIPLMLWWLDALETGRWKTSLALLVCILACKEDYSIVTAPVGLWVAVNAWRTESRSADRRFKLIFGIAHAALLTLYLFLVVKVFIPYFRQGETVHYAAYFRALGSSPQEIMATLLTQPGKVMGLFVTVSSTLYLLCLLIPLGGLPLRSAGRLLTALPLFLTLCLNELVQSTPGPFHHFHAPLIPILFWSAAAGSGTRPFAWEGLWNRLSVWCGCGSLPENSAARRAGLALCCSLLTATVFSISPLGIQFWDVGRGFYWRELYVSGDRARQFEKIVLLIPANARIASTDSIHPRFTHCERSYDYSDYPRAVANYEDKVPDDTTHIVLDTQHPYSRIRRLNDPANPIRELVREPQLWEVLPDQTEGYFIVLRRRAASATESNRARPDSQATIISGAATPDESDRSPPPH